MSLHDPHHDDQLLHPKRPYSIDLTLELERQLENESFPPTPASNLDPQVLASIVKSVTKERDNVLQLLAEANTRETQLRDNLQHVTEKCTKIEGELDEARKKIKDDEDAITMLRTKVEESRYVKKN
jgi:septal ring factor EnvC (AmiA/AmiB activator)